MLDITTRLLLEKYQPNNPLLQDSEPVIEILIAMDANEHNETSIWKACTDFNQAYPQYKSHSYILPTEMHGIPAGSWIIYNQTEGGKQ